MSQFKHIFISYGRKESLLQAAKFHQTLRLNGYDAWFDKVNIPSGDDYLERIKAGIRDAQSFVFFIAPHSLTSEYCLGELEYAVELGKRIFPFMHIEETPEMIAGYSEKQKTVRARTFELLGRRDWLMGREVLGDVQALDQWKLAYENSWHQHTKLEYLQDWVPEFAWESIDKVEETALKLIKETKRDERYVFEHTKLLYEAFEWERKGKLTKDLLVGNERANAEKWLLEDFKGEIPPCVPTQLHAQFIVASKKNAENLMTEAFISYAVPNRQKMELVNRVLERQNISTWVHFFDIDKTKQYAKEIKRGIEEADNFLFFISQKSLVSTWCLEELKYAFELNKRIIPILIEPVEGFDATSNSTENNEAIKALLSLQFVDFTDNISGRVDAIGKTDFERDIDDIVREIKRDEEYYTQHKILLAQALRWQKKQLPSFLLRGYNLENAERWLSRNVDRTEQAPLKIHHEYIKASKANKGILPTDVFISYSRKDSDFARKLNRKLQESGRITWFDQESIASGLDFDQEIFDGIKKTFNFIFVISPDSIASGFCEEELLFAAENEKRFVPILLVESEDYAQLLPPAYKNIQWIDFSKGNNFDKAFHDLEVLLDTDIEHVKYHTELQQRAIEWDHNQRNNDYLLNESALEHAQVWLEGIEKRNPQPTELQKAYIEASQQHIFLIQKEQLETASKLQSRLRISQVAIVIGVILLGVAGYYIYESMRLYEVATSLDKRANLNREQAYEAKRESEILKEEADCANEEAEVSKKQAFVAKEEAKIALEDADNSNRAAQKALSETRLAQMRQMEADKRREMADRQTMKAEKARNFALRIAEEDKNRAESLLMGITAKDIADEDPATALKLMSEAWQKKPSADIRTLFHEIMQENDITKAQIPINIRNFRKGKPGQNFNNVETNSGRNLLLIENNKAFSANLETNLINWEYLLPPFSKMVVIESSPKENYFLLFDARHENFEIRNQKDQKLVLQSPSEENIGERYVYFYNDDRDYIIISSLRMESWNLRTQKLNYILNFENAVRFSFMHNPEMSDQYIIVPFDYFEPTLCLYNIQNGELIKVIEANDIVEGLDDYSPIDMAFDPLNPDFVLVLCAVPYSKIDYRIREWDIKNSKFTKSKWIIYLPTDLNFIALDIQAIRETSNVIIYGFEGGMLYDLKSKKMLSSIAIPKDPYNFSVKAGSYLSVATGDGNDVVYNLKKEKEQVRFFHHNIQYSSFLPESNILRSIGLDKQPGTYNALYWDVFNTEPLLYAQPKFKGQIKDVNFVNNSPYLYASTTEGVTFWHKETKKQISFRKKLEDEKIREDPLVLCFGSFIISTFYHNQVEIWNIDSMSTPKVFNIEGDIDFIDWAQNSEVLLANSGQKMYQIDPQSGAFSFWEAPQWIRKFRILNPEAEHCILEFYDNIGLYEISTGEKVFSVEGQYIDYIKTQNLLVLKQEEQIVFWDLNTKMNAFNIDLRKDIGGYKDVTILSVRFDDQYSKVLLDLYISYEDSEQNKNRSKTLLYQLNFRERATEVLDTFKRHKDIYFLGDDKLLTFEEYYGGYNIYDQNSKSVEKSVELNTDHFIQDVKVSPDNQTLFLYLTDGGEVPRYREIELLDIYSGRKILKLKDSKNWSADIMSHDGKQFILKLSSVDSESFDSFQIWNTDQYLLDWVGENIAPISKKRYESLYLNFMVEEE